MRITMLASIILAATSLQGAQAPQKVAADFQTLGRAVVTELAAAQFDKVEAQFDKAMTSALPEDKLTESWKALIAQVGAFKEITASRIEPVQIYQRAIVTCTFEKATWDAQVVFSSDGKIAGLHFAPSQPKAEWKAPSYADPNSFHEQSVTVADGKWELPGTLALPAHNEPFPGVVLVQGSGPHDQDETIGPNKPFKDLAWGLASRGVAVLRYTKRTLKYRSQSSDDPSALTVDDETVNDARAAAALLAKQPGIDPKRVYVLGHSLGAMLAPRIATGDSQIAGIILMAGNTRPIGQLLIEQVRYISSLEGNSEDAQKRVAAAEQAARDIDNPDLKPGTTVNVLGAKTPASYWLDLRKYNQAEVAAKLSIPIFILQGGRDYQVRPPDFEGWRKALEGHANATLKMYPALNHLFIAGAGPSTPEEYDKPGHVSDDVIADIAAWIGSAGSRTK
jgi:dienelactone hydrolase